MDDQPTITHDHPMITPDDHPLEAGIAKVPGDGDHVITENAIFETKTEPEEARSHDQAITPIEQPAEILDAVSGSATEEEVIASMGVRSEGVRSHDQLITPVKATQNLSPVTDRKPRKGDRIRHFGGKFGTLQEVTKGLAKYQIQWDGAKKSEVYSQKEFNRLDFEIFAPAIEDQVPVHEVDQLKILTPESVDRASPLPNSQQLCLPAESWEKFYRKFKIVCQKVTDGFGYFAMVFHPSGAQVSLNIPAANACAANEWIEKVLDQELSEG